MALRFGGRTVAPDMQKQAVADKTADSEGKKTERNEKKRKGKGKKRKGNGKEASRKGSEFDIPDSLATLSSVGISIFALAGLDIV